MRVHGIHDGVPLESHRKRNSELVAAVGCSSDSMRALSEFLKTLTDLRDQAGTGISGQTQDTSPEDQN